MAHALAMRATSLVVSASLLGLAVILALSATYVVDRLMAPDDGTIIASVEPEPPPPKPDEPDAPRTPPDNTAIADLPFTPLPPLTDAGADPTGTVIAFDPGPATIINPRWLERPRNLARYYPPRALNREVTGLVELDCRVAVTGNLNCSVVSERPANWGFGAAAIRIAQDHRMAPAMRDGVAVEGRYRMSVPFELD